MSASVLSKKLRQGGLARSPLPDSDLVAETLARGIEDRLRPLVKTMLGAEVAGPRVMRLADAVGAIACPALLGVVEVEDADTPALIAIHADLAWHLIDLTLGGDPLAAPTPAPRSLSAIDMALGRIHLDAALEACRAAIGAGLGRPAPKAMRIRDQRQQAGQLRLAPDYIDVLTMRVTVSLAEAGRRGVCDLVLPLSTLDVLRAATEVRASQAARERPNDLWRTLMRRAAAAAPAPVDAVLHRQSLSVAALQGLRAGQVLEIPRLAAEAIELTIAQPGGRRALVAVGRLGASQGRKVVKLDTPVDARLVRHVRSALRPIRPPEPEPSEPAPEAVRP